MATDKNISALVESRVPEYLREEGPNLVAFLKAYYEWMETTGQATDQSKNLLVNQDIDTTNLNKFYEYFRREVLSQFPDNVLVDKRLLAKNIKDLYRSKGSRLSYKLLFRILYNEEIDFINPAENILKTSDGRWSKDAYIRIGAPFVGDPNTLLGLFVTGQTSGATGKVQSIVETLELGVRVKQLRITNTVGSFVDNEVVVGENGASGNIINAVGGISGVTFTDPANDRGGSGHQVGDQVNITARNGVGATGVITGTTENAVTFDIIDGGSGYRANTTLVLIEGGTGSGGSVSVTSISNTETLSFFSDTIFTLANTTIGFGPTYGASSNTDSSIISANLASSTANTPLGSALGTFNDTVGTINSISVTTGNYFVNLPQVTTVDPTVLIFRLDDGAGGIKGRNATIAPRFIPGSISSIDVIRAGRGYSSILPVTVSNQTRTGTTAGRGTPIISGVVEDPGKYQGSKGFLSWDMRLQDSYYYQEFSYVIRSSKSLSAYRDLVKQIVHPAGTKLFGQVDITDDIDISASFDVESIIYLDLIGGQDPDVNVPTTTTFGDIISIDRTLPVQSIINTETFGTLDVGRIFDVPSIEPTAAFGDLEHFVQITVRPTATTTTVSQVGQLDRTVPVESLINVNDVVGPVELERDIPLALIDSIESTLIVPTDIQLDRTIPTQSLISTETFSTDYQLDRTLPVESLINVNDVVGPVELERDIPLALIDSIESTLIIPTDIQLDRTIPIESLATTTTVSQVGQLDRTLSVQSAESTVLISTNSRALLDGAGTVSVSNNDVITTYEIETIDDYLASPIVTLGSPQAVIGTGTLFLTTVKDGSFIELQDLDPGVAGNTTYIVNTVFSNTSLSINTPFNGGSAMANGIYRYTYDGNI